MSQELYSVDQVAARLGLHVRTVRNYVRDGRLRAVRIGKQYRIAREHLEAFTGQTASATEGEPRRHVEVSSIVQIEAITFDAASRLTSSLMAAAKGRPDDDEPLRVDTMYDKERSRLKVILSGSVGSTASLLKFINVFLDQA